MLRKFFLITIALSISSFAAAGSGIFVKGGFGKAKFVSTNDKIKIGVSNTNTSSIIEAGNPILPTNLSLGYEFSIIRPVSISGGVGFQIIGADYLSESISGFSEDWKIEEKDRYNYLTIPFAIKTQIPMRNGGFYATLNPQLSFLLSAKRSIHNSVGDDVTDTTYSIKDLEGDPLNGFNFLLGFRVGGDISIGKHNLFIEAGYDFGLTPTLKNDMILNDEKGNIKTGVLTIIGIGFRFNTSDKFRK